MQTFRNISTRKIGPIYVNICQRIFRVDDPSCPKLQFSHKCRDCLASCKKHILVDAAAAAERERRARHMKKQVLYFCNSMCRQTSSDRIRRSVKMIICLIAVILTDR